MHTCTHRWYTYLCNMHTHTHIYVIMIVIGAVINSQECMGGFEEGKGEAKLIQVYHTCIKDSKLKKSMY